LTHPMAMRRVSGVAEGLVDHFHVVLIRRQYSDRDSLPLVQLISLKLDAHRSRREIVRIG